MAPEQIGRYTIARELGRGGMAIVYLADDPNMKRQVAIKVLPREFTYDEMFRARFRREAEVIASLEHAHIVPLYDFGEHEDQPYIVMRYMPGGSLSDRIPKGPFSLAEAAAILEPIGSALDQAHQEKIIHRDVKPSNILFDKHGMPFLSDFGIVKLTEATAQLTSGGIVGTPAYMAPEMAMSGGLSPLIDIYALAVTLFQMLSGKTPFQADTPMGVLMAHMSLSVPDIRQARSDLPDGVQRVIERGMAKKPEERYQSAHELAADIRALSVEQPISLPEPPSELPPELPTMRADEFTPAEVPTGRSGASLPARTEPPTMKMGDADDAPVRSPAVAVPGIQPARSARRRGLPVGLIVVAGLLLVGAIAVGAIVVGGLLMRGTAGSRAGRAGTTTDGTATSKDGGGTANTTPGAEGAGYESEYPVSDAQKRKPDYQQLSGSLIANYTYVAMEYADISPANFVAEAVFVNPSDIRWSYGFGFRGHVLNSDQCRLYVTSYGEWYLEHATPELKQPLDKGTILSLDTSSGKVNTLTLVADGGNGQFFINGELITKLDLSACTAGETIWVGSNFTEEYAAGKATTFQSFLIWTLP